EFLVELGGEGFVVRQHQSRLADLRDDIGGRKCLAAAGYPHEDLGRAAIAKPAYQLFNRGRLIARRGKRALNLKIGIHVDYFNGRWQTGSGLAPNSNGWHALNVAQ